MELLQGGELYYPIVQKGRLNEWEAKVVVVQVVDALAYLHEQHVIHRDLKPSNLLLNSNCELKICDFGLARGLEEKQELTEYVVTRWYRAPEIMLSCQKYSKAIDVWCVGCIFAELLGRKILFQAQSPIQQLNQVIALLGTPHQDDIRASGASEGAYRYILSQPNKPSQMHTLHTASSNTSHEAVHLLCQMLVFNPYKPLSVMDALSHPYLDEGRLRYHTCMCSCCTTTSSGRQYADEFEPCAPMPYDLSYEDRLYTVHQVKNGVFSFIVDQHRKSGVVPLCLNTASPVYQQFQSSTVAPQPELTDSPHMW
jgi:nemo like kinase